jgi:hypothetical protein
MNQNTGYPNFSLQSEALGYSGSFFFIAGRYRKYHDPAEQDVFALEVARREVCRHGYYVWKFLYSPFGWALITFTSVAQTKISVTTDTKTTSCQMSV